MPSSEKQTTPPTAAATEAENAKIAKAAAKAIARAAKKAARPKLKTKSRKRPRAAQLSLDSNWKNMRGSDHAPKFPAKPNKHKRKNPLPSSEASDSTSDATASSASKAAEQSKSNSSLDVSIVALDCEMVGVGYAKRSSLARVCVVDSRGHVLYDEHVKQKEKVTDFRTKFSGIRKADLIDARPFKEVQARVAELIKDKRLVGHGLENDFSALLMTHPKQLVRDTAHWRPLRKLNQAGKFRPRSLRDLARIVLNKTIQGGEHNPHEDARSALEVYQRFAQLWEVFVSSGGKKMPGQLVKDADGDIKVGVGGSVGSSVRSSVGGGDVFASKHKKRKV